MKNLTPKLVILALGLTVVFILWALAAGPARCRGQCEHDKECQRRCLKVGSCPFEGGR